MTITPSSNNTDVTVSPTSLIFSTSDWNTAQTVTVRAGQDADAANDSARVTHTVSGGGYGSVSASPVTVTVTDDDTAGVTVSETTLTIAEGGSGSYTVVLNTQPSGNVTITPSSNNTDVALSPTPLTFTSSNWDTAQTVTVRAGQDADAANDSARVTHTVSGGDYGSVSASPVAVTVTDDDTAGCDGIGEHADHCRRRQRQLHGGSGHAAERQRDDHAFLQQHRCGAVTDPADLHEQ